MGPLIGEGEGNMGGVGEGAYGGLGLPQWVHEFADAVFAL